MSILDNTIRTLEADIQEAQLVLAQLKSVAAGASANGARPTITKTGKKNSTKPVKVVARKKSLGKAWTPEHRANFIRSMAKVNKAKAEAKAKKAKKPATPAK